MRKTRAAMVSLAALVTVAFGAAVPVVKASSQADGVCPVTIPNDRGLFGETGKPRDGNHGNDAGTLATALSREGIVTFKPGGPGCVDPDGTLGMKFPWWRGVRGQLTIEGRRLDGDAPPLRASIPSGYGPTGFQSSGLMFPTPGCWQVTGRVGEESLSFVVRAVKVDDGPATVCRALGIYERRPVAGVR